MKTSIKLLGASLFLTLLAACASTGAKSGPVNATCPMSNEPAKASVTTTYKGYTIGFCCKKCIGKWNALPAQKKDEMLERWTKAH